MKQTSASAVATQRDSCLTNYVIHRQTIQPGISLQTLL